MAWSPTSTSKPRGSSRCPRPSTSWASSGLQQPLDLGDDLEKVPHQADVGDFEDRGLAVLVDGDDGARILDARQVLDCARDADRDIQLGRDDLAGLPDLHLVGRVT